jgi:DNA replication and repair protein RecF
MNIESLELKNFRNYGELHMEFCPGTNLLYGDNAQGKTNILEAIYVCATARSHRGSKDREVIEFGTDEAHIRLTIRKKESCSRIDMHLKKDRPKGIAVNGVPIRKASELFGIVNVVLFSPEDLNIIKNGPADRRRFMDLELCQLNRLYVHSLVGYNRVLLQRNRLLKDIGFRQDLKETLDVWDLQLVEYGKKLIRYRQLFLEELKPVIRGIHSELSGNREVLNIEYEPNVAEDQMENAVRKSRESDLKQKMTLVGPHRDDIGFYVALPEQQEKGIDIRKFGSQGQQRTAALSLKLAEIEMIRKSLKEDPVLLLDDVLSELDTNRQIHLLSAIRNIQTVITCTGMDDLNGKDFKIDRRFEVKGGTVALKEENE